MFAACFVLQYVVLATAWNILGGYVGYVNFGTTAFLAIGLYSAAALNKWLDLPIPSSFPSRGCCAEPSVSPWDI